MHAAACGQMTANHSSILEMWVARVSPEMYLCPGCLRLGEATPSYDAGTAVSEQLPWQHVTGMSSSAQCALKGNFCIILAKRRLPCILSVHYFSNCTRVTPVHSSKHLVAVVGHAFPASATQKQDK